MRAGGAKVFDKLSLDLGMSQTEVLQKNTSGEVGLCPELGAHAPH